MRILCAVDGSEYSQWGVQTLEALAEREPEHVTLVHVIDKTSLRPAKSRTPSLDKHAQKATEKAGHLLLREAERTAKVALGQAATGPRTTLRRVLAYGTIAPTIVEQARRGKADLIVMGSRGLSDIKGFLLGSTSRRVTSMAPCSVLIVKQAVAELRRVTRPSRVAAQFLRSNILPDSARVTILSSVETPVSDLAARYLSASQISALTQPVMERATRLVTSVRDEFIKEGRTATTMVHMDHVIDTIIKHVEADHADLLVVGSRGLHGVKALGSVSERVAHQAHCSTLIVRKGGTR